MNLKRKPVNLKLSLLVRAALLARGLTLRDWARAEKISRTQVSMALSGKRADARSKMIVSELRKLVEGAKRGRTARSKGTSRNQAGKRVRVS